MLRALTTLLDEWLPVIPGSEINDDPIAPLSAFGQNRVKAEGDDMPIRWLPREARYVEKLATPDVTIADMIGDIDPIKAAKGGLQLGSELAMHFGLLPRANRGIFAINELPDLAGKIQVGLFNILQEGDVQIKGYPVRLPLDVMIAFTANPEDYTARGKIITPLKDRIGAEIRTHYMPSRADALSITEQEAWVDARRRDRGAAVRARGRRGDRVPGAQRAQDRQALGRQPAHADQRARNRRLERRAARARQRRVAGRAARHRHLRGAAVDDRQVRARIRRRAQGRRSGRARAGARRGRHRVRRLLSATPTRKPIIEWFDLGGSLDPVGHDRRRDARQGGRACRASSTWRTAPASHRDAPAPALAAAHRLRARRAVLAEEDQPQRRSRLPRRRAGPSPQPQQRAPPVLTPDDDEDDDEGGGGRRSGITTESGWEAGILSGRSDSDRT